MEPIFRVDPMGLSTWGLPASCALEHCEGDPSPEDELLGGGELRPQRSSGHPSPKGGEESLGQLSGQGLKSSTCGDSPPAQGTEGCDTPGSAWQRPRGQFLPGQSLWVAGRGAGSELRGPLSSGARRCAGRGQWGDNARGSISGACSAASRGALPPGRTPPPQPGREAQQARTRHPLSWPFEGPGHKRILGCGGGRELSPAGRARTPPQCPALCSIWASSWEGLFPPTPSPVRHPPSWEGSHPCLPGGAEGHLPGAHWTALTPPEP